MLPAPRFEATAAAPLGRMAYGDVVERESDEESGDGSLLEYGRMLARNKGTPAIAACLGMLAGLLLSLPQTPIYQGRTSLEIESLNENFFNLREVNPTTVNSRFNTEFEIATQVRILQSRALVGKVVDALQLGRKPRFTASGRPTLGLEASARACRSRARSRSRACDRSRIGLVYGRAFQENPHCRDRLGMADPDLAADFSNTLADAFIEHNPGGTLEVDPPKR